MPGYHIYIFRLFTVLPLLAGRYLCVPQNPRVVNSVRLVMPHVDLVNWRERAAKAHSPYTQNYQWAADNSLIPSVIPEEDEDDEGWFDQERPPKYSSSRNKGKSSSGKREVRSPQNNRVSGQARNQRSKASSSSSSSDSGRCGPLLLSF